MTERKMLLGSEGNLDYLVVAERGDTALAVKAFLAGSNKYGMSYGVRIRVALLPSASQPMKAKMTSGKLDWKALWPEFEWKRIAAERASTVVMVPSGHMMWDYAELQTGSFYAATAVLQFITKRLEHATFDDPDMLTFVTKCWEEDLLEVQKEFPAKPKIIFDDLQAKYMHDLFEVASEGEVSPMAAIKSTIATKPKFDVIEGGKGKPAPAIEDDDVQLLDMEHEETDEDSVFDNGFKPTDDHVS